MMLPMAEDNAVLSSVLRDISIFMSFSSSGVVDNDVVPLPGFD